jgi:hypothetical protein
LAQDEKRRPRAAFSWVRRDALEGESRTRPTLRFLADWHEVCGDQERVDQTPICHVSQETTMNSKLALRNGLFWAAALALATAYAGGDKSQSQGSSDYTKSAQASGSMSGGSTMSGGTSGATGGSTSGMSGGSYKNADEAWKAMNTSGQPYLTQKDLASHPEIDFSAADTNHDGKITKSEFEKAWNMAHKGGASGTTSGFTGGSTGSSSGSSSMSSPSGTSSSGMSNPAYKDHSK